MNHVAEGRSSRFHSTAAGRSWFPAALALLALGASPLAEGQADPSSFETVVNLPEDFFSNEVPEFFGSNTQINVSQGAAVTSSFSSGPFLTGLGSSDGSVNNVEVNIVGGFVIGATFNAGSTLNVFSTAPNNNLATISGGVVNVFGGRVDNLSIRSGSEVNVFGGLFSSGVGLFGRPFNTGILTTVNVFGGVFESEFSAQPLGSVTVGGGVFNDAFTASGDSNLEFLGTEFFLDDQLIALSLGESFALTARDATLSGTFADGSAFSFDLNSTDVNGQDFFATNANVTLTVVPEPTTLALLGLGGLALLRRRVA